MRIAFDSAGPLEAKVTEAWLHHLPHRFSVARDDRGHAIGFCVFCDDADLQSTLERSDSLLGIWKAHRLANRRSGQVIFMRQMLAIGPDAPLAKSACLLDLKRHYLTRRELGRVYSVAKEEALISPAYRRIGFRPLTAAEKNRPASMVLDLPAGGLETWIASLIDRPSSDARPEFDRLAGEIRLDGEIVRLTRLEASVLGELIDRAPQVVMRDTLIDNIWQRNVVGSNVVDAVIRTLRQKLGRHSAYVETVPKVGYRWRSRGPSDDA